MHYKRYFTLKPCDCVFRSVIGGTDRGKQRNVVRQTLVAHRGGNSSRADHESLSGQQVEGYCQRNCKQAIKIARRRL
jgi:hypothetical protein